MGISEAQFKLMCAGTMHEGKYDSPTTKDVPPVTPVELAPLPKAQESKYEKEVIDLRPDVVKAYERYTKLKTILTSSVFWLYFVFFSLLGYCCIMDTDFTVRLIKLGCYGWTAFSFLRFIVKRYKL